MRDQEMNKTKQHNVEQEIRDVAASTGDTANTQRAREASCSYRTPSEASGSEPEQQQRQQQ